MTSVVDNSVDVKIVTCKPVSRKYWYGDQSNAGKVFEDAFNMYQVEMDSQTRQLKTGLTEEDERRLEKALHLAAGTLNKYNKDYWSALLIKVPKKGKQFFLDNPKDELEYKVLLKHSLFAPTGLAVNDMPEAQYYFTSDEQDAKVENTKIKTERDAVKEFGKLSASGMLDVLKYFALLEGRRMGTLTKASSLDIIEATLYKRVKENPEEFLKAVNNKSFKTIVFIEKCIENKILTKSGSKYSIIGGETIGVTLDATIEYLEDPHNNDVYFMLKEKLEAVDK